MKTFADRLESLRKGLTQKAFADKIGVPLNTYTAWLRSERLPSYEAIASMCTALCVSADWLVGISTDPPPTEKKVSMDESRGGYKAVCHECKKKQEHIDRLERIIDKLTK